MSLFALYRKGPFAWLWIKFRQLYGLLQWQPGLGHVPDPDMRYHNSFNESARQSEEPSSGRGLLLGPAGLLPPGWDSRLGPTGRYYVHLKTKKTTFTRPKALVGLSATRSHIPHAEESNRTYGFEKTSKQQKRNRPKYWRAGNGGSRPRLSEAQQVFSLQTAAQAAAQAASQPAALTLSEIIAQSAVQTVPRTQGARTPQSTTTLSDLRIPGANNSQGVDWFQGFSQNQGV